MNSSISNGLSAKVAVIMRLLDSHAGLRWEGLRVSIGMTSNRYRQHLRHSILRATHR